jgi:glucosamine 6-phosphate synthetase-like amidotransferase/phosphosugar isomerase protein
MCAITGFLNYGHKVPHNILLHLVKSLTVAAECRGTDATGISYVSNCEIVTYKKPKPARKLKFYFPYDTTAVIAHNRMTTQGSELKNYNNHPFEGVADKPFALTHNGVIYNDAELRSQHHLPDTEIETDSYIAVQLLEEQGSVSFESIKAMAEELLGSYTFSILDADNNLWLVKGSNPLHLIHFPDLQLYVYASTQEIMNKALKSVRLRKIRHTVIDTREGDILHIDRYGNIQRGKFTPKEDDWQSFRCFAPGFYGWDSLAPSADPLDDSYAALIELCGYFGVEEDDVMYLFEMGYSIAEIEEFIMNPHLLDEAFAEGY